MTGRERDEPTFDEPTLTTARPAADALRSRLEATLTEHVNENLELHRRVTLLEAKLAAPESERLADLQKRVRRAIEMLDHPRGPMPVGEILAVLRV